MAGYLIQSRLELEHLRDPKSCTVVLPILTRDTIENSDNVYMFTYKLMCTKSTAVNPSECNVKGYNLK